MKIVEDGVGGYRVIGESEPLSKTVAWRIPMSEHSELLTFVESFPERTLAAAMRWLMRQPEVRTLMREKVRAAARPARKRAENGQPPPTLLDDSSVS